jgi:hypothetical protein
MRLPYGYDDGEIELYAEVDMNKPDVDVYAKGNMHPVYLDTNMSYVPSHFKYARIYLNIHVEIQSKGIVAFKFGYLVHHRNQLEWD